MMPSGIVTRKNAMPRGKKTFAGMGILLLEERKKSY